MNDQTITRAKPLNALTLAAIPDMLMSVDEDIAYLKGAVSVEMPADASLSFKRLRDHQEQRLANLQRGRDWLHSVLVTRSEGGAA